MAIVLWRKVREPERCAFEDHVVTRFAWLPSGGERRVFTNLCQVHVELGVVEDQELINPFRREVEILPYDWL